MERIITALILGLSLDRLFICPFLTFGLALSEKKAAARFLLGRILGIIILSALFISLGVKRIPVDRSLVDILFGVLIIIFAGTVLLKKKEPGKYHKHSKASGFGLGLFRGMLTPGRKIILLFPLLIGAGFYKGMVITIVYALSSSVYLVLGFLGGEFCNRLLSYRKTVKITGAIILIGLGLFYIGKGVLR